MVSRPMIWICLKRQIFLEKFRKNLGATGVFFWNITLGWFVGDTTTIGRSATSRWRHPRSLAARGMRIDLTRCIYFVPLSLVRWDVRVMAWLLQSSWSLETSANLLAPLSKTCNIVFGSVFNDHVFQGFFFFLHFSRLRNIKRRFIVCRAKIHLVWCFFGEK